MKKSKFALSFIVCLLLLAFGQKTFAEESSAEGYSVSANIPEFQRDTNVSYFDLLLEPKDQKEISIHLVNNSSESSTFDINVNNATTNSNGVIDYSKTNIEKDPSMTYELNKLVTPKMQEVTLKGGEQKDIAFQVKMPDDSFKGIILGGIHIEKKDDKSKKVKGTGIQNKYAYVIGIKLQNDLDQVEPDLKLLSAKPGLQNSYTTIFAQIQNPKATIISKLDVKAKVTKKNQKKILYSAENKEVSVAPNSNFKFPIEVKKKLDSGDYTVSIDAIQRETGMEWHLTKDFTIKPATVESVNQEAVIEQEPVNYFPYILAVGMILVVIIIFLVYKLRTQQK